MLLHVAKRPLTLLHCPDGLAAPCNYLRHAKAWGAAACPHPRENKGWRISGRRRHVNAGHDCGQARSRGIDESRVGILGEDDRRARSSCRGPVQAGTGWSECLSFARDVSEAIARTDPRRYTTTFAKAGREETLLIDYLRNNRTNISVCAFSPRARPGAFVSMRVAWRDLPAGPERGPCRRFRRG